MAILQEAAAASIVEPLGSTIFQIHPALPWYLRQRLEQQAANDGVDTADGGIANLEKKLLSFYGGLADYYREQLISKVEEASFVLRVEEPNLLQQLRLAEQQEDWGNAQSLLQALGDLYKRIGRKPELRALCEQGLFQVGIRLSEVRDKGSGASEFWMYLQGRKANDALDSADIDGAREILEELLAELELLRDPKCGSKIAVAQHQLGIVAQKQRRFDDAIALYQKALKTFEDAGDLYNAADEYHQLGMVAQEQRRFDDAIALYQKALKIFEDAGDLYRAATDYHHLGIVAEEQRRFDDAIALYQKALKIKEDAGDLYNAADEYHQLGIVAEEQRRFDDAIALYQKALKIYEDAGDLYSAARDYYLLGRVAEAQENYSEALQYYILTLAIALEHNQDLIPLSLTALGGMLKQFGTDQFKALWREITQAECPDEYFSAIQAASQQSET